MAWADREQARQGGRHGQGLTTRFNSALLRRIASQADTTCPTPVANTKMSPSSRDTPVAVFMRYQAADDAVTSTSTVNVPCSRASWPSHHGSPPWRTQTPRGSTQEHRHVHWPQHTTCKLNSSAEWHPERTVVLRTGIFHIPSTHRRSHVSTATGVATLRERQSGDGTTVHPSMHVVVVQI